MEDKGRLARWVSAGLPIDPVPVADLEHAVFIGFAERV